MAASHTSSALPLLLLKLPLQIRGRLFVHAAKLFSLETQALIWISAAVVVLVLRRTLEGSSAPWQMWPCGTGRLPAFRIL